MKPETVFRKNRVLPFLKTLANTVIFPIQQMAIGGTPDFLLCCNGRFVALELKSEGGRVSKLQEFNMAEVRRCRGAAIVASPKNWEQVKSYLSRLDQGENHDPLDLRPA